MQCSRGKCLICENPLNKTFNCGKRNVTYSTVCLTCDKQTKESANRKQEEIPASENDVESEEKAEAEEQIM